MIETIEFKGHKYLLLQSTGFAAKFAFPFAKEILFGTGYDLGCNRPEWAFIDKYGVPAIQIDPVLNPGYDALNLPETKVDYFMSSHALEHIPQRISEVLEYWLTKLRPGGIIYLYLPNCDYQKYWAWGNKKHVHYLNPAIMKDCLNYIDGIKTFLVTEGYDLNGSFHVIIEKA